jgi:hypothetical protein
MRWLIARRLQLANKDWSIGGTLTMLEQYNGLGYASRGRPSPYIWSGTDQYVSGKYVRDGVYDPSAVDQQLGCAGLLMAMMALDPTITFTGTKITPNITVTTISPKPRCKGDERQDGRIRINHCVGSGYHLDACHARLYRLRFCADGFEDRFFQHLGASVPDLDRRPLSGLRTGDGLLARIVGRLGR